MEQKKTDNLSKVDVISFVAILLLGVAVFFGLNFSMLGDLLISSIAAVVLIVFLMGVESFASYAKGQDYDFTRWKTIEIVTLIIYFGLLVPAYFYTAKFADVMSDKAAIVSEVNKEIESINKMFDEYEYRTTIRRDAYETQMNADFQSPEGRKRLEKQQGHEMTADDIVQTADNFLASLQNKDYDVEKIKKNNFIGNSLNNFRNWNMIEIPKDAALLSEKGKEYAKVLAELYVAEKAPTETEVEPFEAESILVSTGVVDKFSSSVGFSVLGLVTTLLLGIIGLSKYLFTPRSRIIIPSKKTYDRYEEDEISI